jgi:hypothetical protein
MLYNTPNTLGRFMCSNAKANTVFIRINNSKALRDENDTNYVYPQGKCLGLLM